MHGSSGATATLAHERSRPLPGTEPSEAPLLCHTFSYADEASLPALAWQTGFPYFGDAADMLDAVGLWNRERMRVFLAGSHRCALSGEVWHWHGVNQLVLLDPVCRCLHVFAADESAPQTEPGTALSRWLPEANQPTASAENQTTLSANTGA